MCFQIYFSAVRELKKICLYKCTKHKLKNCNILCFVLNPACIVYTSTNSHSSSVCLVQLCTTYNIHYLPTIVYIIYLYLKYIVLN